MNSNMLGCQKAGLSLRFLSRRLGFTCDVGFYE